MSEVLYTIKFHFENVPDFLQNKMEETFMKNRSKVVAMFNELIDGINDEWDKTGQPFAYGDYLEDVNPKYSEYIIEQMQPYLDELNKNFHFCKFKLDEYCDIVGYLPFIKDSKLWIDLEEYKP